MSDRGVKQAECQTVHGAPRNLYRSLKTRFNLIYKKYLQLNKIPFGASDNSVSVWRSGNIAGAAGADPATENGLPAGISPLLAISLSPGRLTAAAEKCGSLSLHDSDNSAPLTGLATFAFPVVDPMSILKSTVPVQSIALGPVTQRRPFIPDGLRQDCRDHFRQPRNLLCGQFTGGPFRRYSTAMKNLTGIQIADACNFFLIE